MIDVDFLITLIESYLLQARVSLKGVSKYIDRHMLVNYIEEYTNKLNILKDVRSIYGSNGLVPINPFSNETYTSLIRKLWELDKQSGNSEQRAFISITELYKIFRKYKLFMDRECSHLYSMDRGELQNFLNSFSEEQVGTVGDMANIPIRFWYVISLEGRKLLGRPILKNRESVFLNILSSITSAQSKDFYTERDDIINSTNPEQYFFSLLMKGLDEYYFNESICEKIYPSKQIHMVKKEDDIDGYLFN